MDNKWLTMVGNTLLKCSVEAKGQIMLSEGYTKIIYGAFEHCEQITKVTLPSTIATIGAGAFRGCTYLSTVDLSIPLVDNSIISSPNVISLLHIMLISFQNIALCH